MIQIVDTSLRWFAHEFRLSGRFQSHRGRTSSPHLRRVVVTTTRSAGTFQFVSSRNVGQASSSSAEAGEMARRVQLLARTPNAIAMVKTTGVIEPEATDVSAGPGQ